MVWLVIELLLYIVQVVDGICVLLGGEVCDFGDIQFDECGIFEFCCQVYVLMCVILFGQMCIYGEIVVVLGQFGVVCVVGWVEGDNLFLFIVFCYCVMGVGGDLMGFLVFGGIEIKWCLLFIEVCVVGQLVGDQQVLF